MVYGERGSGKSFLLRLAQIDDSTAVEFKTTPRQIAGQIGFIVVGLALLIVGARWLVNGAVTIARIFQVNELVIALTIVAGGTSLPEIATSIVATVS